MSRLAETIDVTVFYTRYVKDAPRLKAMWDLANDPSGRLRAQFQVGECWSATRLSEVAPRHWALYDQALKTRPSNQACLFFNYDDGCKAGQSHPARHFCMRCGSQQHPILGSLLEAVEGECPEITKDRTALTRLSEKVGVPIGQLLTIFNMTSVHSAPKVLPITVRTVKAVAQSPPKAAKDTTQTEYPTLGNGGGTATPVSPAAGGGWSQVVNKRQNTNSSFNSQSESDFPAPKPSTPSSPAAPQKTKSPHVTPQNSTVVSPQKKEAVHKPEPVSEPIAKPVPESRPQPESKPSAPPVRVMPKKMPMPLPRTQQQQQLAAPAAHSDPETHIQNGFGAGNGVMQFDFGLTPMQAPPEELDPQRPGPIGVPQQAPAPAAPSNGGPPQPLPTPPKDVVMAGLGPLYQRMFRDLPHGTSHRFCHYPVEPAAGEAMVFWCECGECRRGAHTFAARYIPDRPLKIDSHFVPQHATVYVYAKENTACVEMRRALARVAVLPRSPAAPIVAHGVYAPQQEHQKGTEQRFLAVLRRSSDLRTWLAQSHEPEMAVKVARGVIDAVATCHSTAKPPVFHRNLSPRSILVSVAYGTPQVELVDFDSVVGGGVAGRHSPDSGNADDLWRFPYAVADSSADSLMRDMWSLGLVIYEVLRNPTADEDERVARQVEGVPLLVQEVVDSGCTSGFSARFGGMSHDVDRYRTKWFTAVESSALVKPRGCNPLLWDLVTRLMRIREEPNETLSAERALAHFCVVDPTKISKFIFRVIECSATFGLVDSHKTRSAFATTLGMQQYEDQRVTDAFVRLIWRVSKDTIEDGAKEALRGADGFGGGLKLINALQFLAGALVSHPRHGLTSGSFHGAFLEPTATILTQLIDVCEQMRLNNNSELRLVPHTGDLDFEAIGAPFPPHPRLRGAPDTI